MRLNWDKHKCFFLPVGKYVQTSAETMVVDGRNQKPLALLCLALGPPLSALNSSEKNFDIDRVRWSWSALSSIYAVPVMSPLCTDWFCCFFCYITLQVMVDNFLVYKVFVLHRRTQKVMTCLQVTPKSLMIFSHQVAPKLKVMILEA